MTAERNFFHRWWGSSTIGSDTNAIWGMSVYKWKAKYGGMQVCEVKRLKALEDENGKLKKLLAETMLDNAGLKGLLAKNF